MRIDGHILGKPERRRFKVDGRGDGRRLLLSRVGQTLAHRWTPADLATLTLRKGPSSDSRDTQTTPAASRDLARQVRPVVVVDRQRPEILVP